ncbi:MAG: NADH-quinone oxidoreductase subunit L [Deltaproteobacteria bacterium]|nr:NADH-quinone oxidoreductase subunit L [Deltaproteobacteria bacterium]
MAQQALLIALFPLVAFVIQALFGKKLPRHGDFVSVLAIFGSFAVATPIFMKLLTQGHVFDTFEVSWMTLPGIEASGRLNSSVNLVVGVLINNITAIMLFMVTLCASLIHLFSVGYMHGEERYHLFFAYISLFSAGMLGLVLSDNLLTFFMCWELMGLCSYLLIGFYYKKPSAINASIKAFMTTRVGDTMFFLGIAGLYYVYGTSNFMAIYKAIQAGVAHDITIAGFPALTLIGFLVMMGTVGKSAQFPLQVWLPDAMEGPTPVSALIHAATMVAAGVFLLIRMFPLLEASHVVLPVVAYVGAITAFLAACIAIVQVDIKKVLAYSTISQLGYMVMGVGVGAFAPGFMHLITHACFKACLFLCSGSVIHSVHTQDMREMGGLKSKMPITFATMFIATLAISGVPGFSGFVSKDRILGGALAYSMEHHGHYLIPLLGFATAGITAFYMFRMIYMTFFGHARDEHKHHHAHEQPLTMTIPLMILAGLSFAIVFAGPTGIESVDHVMPVKWFDQALEGAQQEMGIAEHLSPEAEAVHHQAHGLALMLSLAVAGLGILISSITYLKHLINAEAIKKMVGPLYTLLWNKYYFDELYLGVLIQKGLLNFNRMLAMFDDKVVDRIFVDGWRDVTMVIKSFIGKFDDIVVDRVMVDGTADVTAGGGWIVRQFQTGKVQQYLVLTVMVIIVALFYANLGLK